MTVNDLLALLGRSWTRLFLYPGGLSAFALVALIGILLWLFPRFRGQGVGGRGQGFAPWTRFWQLAFDNWQLERTWHGAPGFALRISAIICPWLGLAMLPLPKTISLDRSIDIIGIVALFEWPLILVLASDFQAPCDQRWRTVARQLAAVLNGYPVLLLALLLLALSTNSFQIAAFVQTPDTSTTVVPLVLYWVGAATLTLALPPICGFGPFATHAPLDPTLRIGLRLRTIGFILLAALPWFALLDEPDLLQPLIPLLIALLLWVYDLSTLGGKPRHWAYGYLVLAALQLLALLSAAIVALQERLV